MSNNETVVVEVNKSLQNLLTPDTTLNRRWALAAVIFAQVVIGLVPVLTKVCQQELKKGRSTKAAMLKAIRWGFRPHLIEDHLEEVGVLNPIGQGTKAILKLNSFLLPSALCLLPCPKGDKFQCGDV